MKKFSKIILVFLLIFLVQSCSDNDRDLYDGAPSVNFNNGISSTALILSTQTEPYNDVKIKFGTIRPTQGSNAVKLVVDATKSTAVEGTDFQILNNATDELTDGEMNGEFTVRVFKTPATQAGKTAVFNLKSGSLQNAVFNQTYTLSIALTCPASSFPGFFSATNLLFGDTWDVEIVAGTTPNTLIIKDYIEVGYDITVNYDPSSGVVSLPAAAQPTGYVNGANGMIMIKAAVDGSKGTIDFCNRKMNLRLSYGTPTGATYNVGGSTSITDVFEGF